MQQTKLIYYCPYQTTPAFNCAFLVCQTRMRKKVTMESKKKRRHAVVVEKLMEFLLANFDHLSFSPFLLELIGIPFSIWRSFSQVPRPTC